jgi:hypothetical protein
MTPIDQLTQDLSNAQAEIARLRNTLDYLLSHGLYVNGHAKAIIVKALSQSSPSLALQEYKEFDFDNNKIRAIVMEKTTYSSNKAQIIDETITAIRKLLSASPTNTKG